jgi:hypothetical protein
MDLKSTSTSDTHHLQDRFLGIALKISLYPVSLIVANVILSGISLISRFSIYRTVLTTSRGYILQLYAKERDDIHDSERLFGGIPATVRRARVLLCHCTLLSRPKFFALSHLAVSKLTFELINELCISVDPSFRGGVSAAWLARRNARIALHGRPALNDMGDPDCPPAHVGKISFGQFLTSINGAEQPVPPVLCVELKPGAEPAFDEVDVDVDVIAALTVLPYIAPYAFPGSLTPEDDPIDHNNNIKSGPGHVVASPLYGHPGQAIQGPPRRFSRVFAGVTSDALPLGLSDGVDVDLRLSYELPTRFARPRDIAAVQGMRQLGAVALSDMIEDESKEYGLEGRGQAFTPASPRQGAAGDRREEDAEVDRRTMPNLTFDAGPSRRVSQVDAVREAKKRFDELNAML